MMEFRTIKQAIIDTLSAAAAGRFVVIGHQRQKKSAETINANRLVQVYYTTGQFPKSGGKQIGSKAHDMKFNIDLTVSESAEGDISTLGNPASTALQRQTALAAVQEATDKADSQIDDLIDIIFQILMDARNIDLGLTKGTFADRWITTVQKDTTIEEGGFAVKTANIQYTCKTDEDIVGDTGTAISPDIYDATIDIDGDGVEKTGVTVTNT